MSDHPWGWLCLLPSLITIVIAVVTHRVVPALLLGIFSSALILEGWNPLEALERLVAIQLWPSLTDPDRLSVFAFTTLMGAMVGLINRCGGMRGLVEIGSSLARSPRSGQLTGWMLGLFVFFDDYANSLLLGKTLQPLTDRLRVSREKLAYIVDSTAAPVAGLALISTWVATEIQYIQNGLDNISPDLEGKAGMLFLASIPYRFYVWIALLLVPLLALTRREYGPMYRAEMRARQGDPIGYRNIDAAAGGVSDPTEAEKSVPSRWYNAVLPIAITVIAVVYFLYQSGIDPSKPDKSLQQIFGDSDPYRSLIWGALWGLLSTVVLVVGQRLLSWSDIQNATWHGAVKMIPALVILWLAGALTSTIGGNPVADREEVESQAQQIAHGIQGLLYQAGETIPFEPDNANSLAIVQQELIKLEKDGLDAVRAHAVVEVLGIPTQRVNEVLPESLKQLPQQTTYLKSDSQLYAGPYLSSRLNDNISMAWLPTIVFVFSAFIAFATGTSWGTMALVMPITVEVVMRGTMSNNEIDLNHTLLLGSIGGVLAGAIFGDHCSPISDTTVLSSQASGCDHMAHVTTQAPYAVVGAAIAIVLGTIPLGFGLPLIAIWPLQIGGLIATTYLLGKVVPDKVSDTD